MNEIPTREDVMPRPTGPRPQKPSKPSGSGRSRAAAAPIPTILLVDDHPIWRDSLRRLLERRRAGRVIGEASDGEEALARALTDRPDIVIMDVDLPTIDGIEATRRIHRNNPETKIMCLSALQAKEDVVAAIEAGASGYLLKTTSSADVVRAVQRVHAGEMVFPPALTAIVLDRLRASGSQPRIAVRTGRRAAAEPAGNAFRREGEFWTLSHDGDTIRLKDSKGMRYIADLLRNRGTGLHVMELVAAGVGVDPSASTRRAAAAARPDLRPDTGTSSSLLDPQARAAYRARLGELSEEIEEAEAWNDQARAGGAREEMEFILAELAKAVGLGGRDRRAASASERARVNVARAISSALKRIDAAHPTLAAHLATSIKTGTFCSYEPEAPVTWSL